MSLCACVSFFFLFSSFSLENCWSVVCHPCFALSRLSVSVYTYELWTINLFGFRLTSNVNHVKVLYFRCTEIQVCSIQDIIYCTTNARVSWYCTRRFFRVFFPSFFGFKYFSKIKCYSTKFVTSTPSNSYSFHSLYLFLLLVYPIPLLWFERTIVVFPIIVVVVCFSAFHSFIQCWCIQIRCNCFSIPFPCYFPWLYTSIGL